MGFFLYGALLGSDSLFTTNHIFGRSFTHKLYKHIPSMIVTGTAFHIYGKFLVSYKKQMRYNYMKRDTMEKITKIDNLETKLVKANPEVLKNYQQKFGID